MNFQVRPITLDIQQAISTSNNISWHSFLVVLKTKKEVALYILKNENKKNMEL